MDSKSEEEIQFEFFPFLRVYKNGHMIRLYEADVVPPSTDPTTGVTSKDITIDSDTGVSARLYLPKLSSSIQKKLPVLVYYHGGGFCIGTAFSSALHNYMNSLVSKAQVVAVSVDYRQLPEHPLPTPYDDSWVALKWVFSQAAAADGDAWLAEHGDFSRVFLAGDSAGGNIAHQMVVWARNEVEVSIKGVALVHPFFSGEESEEVKQPGSKVREFWKCLCPGTVGLDDPLINPVADGGKSLEGLACEKVMVCVAEKDVLRDKGREFYETLKGSGWKGEVEFFETLGEGHVFHLFNPGCDKAGEMMECMAAFLNKE